MAPPLPTISPAAGLPNSYRHLTDYMSGFFALNLERCLPLIRQVDVNGFKFLYELLAISHG